jgi:simple sugar transport system substrate-binding protein
MRKSMCAVLLVIAVAVVATAAPAGKTYTFYAIGVQPGVDTFFATVYKGMMAAADSFPVKLNYLGLTGDEVNAAGMANKLEVAIAAKPDGIITGIWFPDSESKLLNDAIAKGIPVLAYNTPDTRSADVCTKYIGYVGQDERTTGEILAKATLTKTKIVRTVVGLMYPGSTPIENRANGIMRVMAANNIPIEKLNLTTDPATATNVLGAYLTKYPDTNVVFVLGPVSVNPALQLLKDRGLIGKVSIATFDVDQKTLDGISAGTIIYTVIQQPFAQGFLSVEQLYLYNAFGVLPPVGTPTGPTLVDKSNLDIVKKQLAATGGS